MNDNFTEIVMNLNTLKLVSKELLLFNNYVFIDKKNEMMVQVNIDLTEISNQFLFTKTEMFKSPVSSSNNLN
jgi:hypothetical protein